MILFEYLSATGRPEVTEWRLGLENVQRVQLDQQLDRLEETDDPELAQAMMAGPIVQHVFKLQVGGKIRLRPMVCFGPTLPRSEITVLCGALEKDGALVPSGAQYDAQRYRNAIVKDAARRRAFARPPETRWRKKERK